ncbi:TIGR03943 family putative permease subunit [Enterococcus sp. LJL51]|uniref:TIGR03943 family putative permease subunit n=1 Tax=Enterococcus sp. LJL51 TaxID=3416656 RepID=UPI003CE8BE00
MTRFIIFAGYALLMMSLQLSGKLNQYINTHYRYLAILSMVLSLFLAIIQLISWTREDKSGSYKQLQDHETEHHHSLKPYQQIFAYILLALPLVVGFVFPTVSLDTTIVEAKGFQFPLSQEATGDPDMQTQYLKPDTSIYFDKADYDEQMNQLMAEYADNQVLTITDENYLEIVELIYNFPSEFQGKSVSYKGFIFHSNQESESDTFVFRFGIIHCVADAGVFGLLTRLPENQVLANNDWVEIKGTLSTEYYHPFQRTLPIVNAVSVKQISAPENQYVYRSF